MLSAILFTYLSTDKRVLSNHVAPPRGWNSFALSGQALHHAYGATLPHPPSRLASGEGEGGMNLPYASGTIREALACRITFTCGYIYLSLLPPSFELSYQASHSPLTTWVAIFDCILFVNIYKLYFFV